MFVGYDKDSEQLIYINDALNTKDHTFICPVCGGELIIKNGDINAAHFAHKDLQDCDTFTADMSEWHKEWQERFPLENREVVLSLDIDEFEYFSESRNYSFSHLKQSDASEKRHYYISTYVYLPEEKRRILHISHRADILINNCVIEFQNSPISKAEFNERNWFYNKCGYRVIWIFNLSEKSKNFYISRETKKDNKKQLHYRWNWAYKMFADFCPQHHKAVFNNGTWINSDIMLLFQFDENQIEKVIWAYYNEERDETYYRRHITEPFHSKQEVIIRITFSKI